MLYLYSRIPTDTTKEVSTPEFIENILVEKKEMSALHFDKLIELFIFYQDIHDLAAFGRRYS